MRLILNTYLIIFLAYVFYVSTIFFKFAMTEKFFMWSLEQR